MADPESPLNVYLTVDTEIWCSGWDNIDAKFPKAYDNYIYGRTSKGNYGLPFQLQLLKEHGLKAVFFVEPLFSLRFGKDALQEIVGLIHDANQRVELHLHTEWVDEARKTIFSGIKEKRQHLKSFTLEEQIHLISLGIELLKEAGCDELKAFRAGSFGANNDTLSAIKANGLEIDSSYNYCSENCEISVFNDIQQPVSHEEVIEVPITNFIDGFRRRRHAQLTACSFSEFQATLNLAHQKQHSSYTLLSHSFELMKPGFIDKDKIIIKRFEKILAFLASNNDRFRTCNFNDNTIDIPTTNHQHLQIDKISTVKRYCQQTLRRVI